VTPDFIYGITPGDVGYDVESYPNLFTFTAKHADTGKVWYFEISEWRNDHQSLCDFLEVLRDQGCRMVGFFSLTYDYPMIHFIYQSHALCLTAADIYDKSQSILNTPYHNRF